MKIPACFMLLASLTIIFTNVSSAVLGKTDKRLNFSSLGGTSSIPLTAPSLVIPSKDLLSASTTIHLHRRWDHEPCSAEEYSAYQCKGQKYLYQMYLDDHSAGQELDPPVNSIASRFTQWPAEFINWGYSFVTMEDCDWSANGFGLSTAFTALGISTAAQDWECTKMVHGDKRRNIAPPIEQQSYNAANGRLYPFTGAEFEMPMNVRNGVIVWVHRISPYESGRLLRNGPIAAANLPELQRSSDVTWGLWKYNAGDALKSNVKYIISWAISNTETESVIARVLLEAGMRLERWPTSGASFAMGTKSGDALLGTPNGVGIGHFLSQHKTEIGLKHVTRVGIFQPDSTKGVDSPCLIFMVEDSTSVPSTPGNPHS